MKHVRTYELTWIIFLFFALSWTMTFMGKRAKQLTAWWGKLYNAQLCSSVLMQDRDAVEKLEIKSFLSGAALLAVSWDESDFSFLLLLFSLEKSHNESNLIPLNTGYKERYLPQEIVEQCLETRDIALLNVCLFCFHIVTKSRGSLQEGLRCYWFEQRKYW